MAFKHTLQIGQVNLGGFAVATKELPALAEELRLDIVLLQEHYSQAQRDGPVVLEFGGVTGAPAKAAILVKNQRIQIVALHHLSTTHCAVASIQAGSEEIYLISAYFQYSDDIEPHLQLLESVLVRLRGKRVIIGADANVHSPWWHSEPRHYIGRGAAAERRRQLLEDFISSEDLIVHNIEGQPSTFSGPNGESNIDVTLGKRSAPSGEDPFLVIVAPLMDAFLS